MSISEFVACSILILVFLKYYNKTCLFQILYCIMAKPKSRSEVVKWLVGDVAPDIVGENEDGVLLFSHYKSQLPSHRDVLKHVFHLKQEGMKNAPIVDIADEVVLEVQVVWDKAKIPTIGRHFIKKRVINLFNKWRSILSSPL